MKNCRIFLPQTFYNSFIDKNIFDIPFKNTTMLINVKHIYCKTKIGSTSEIVEYLYESYNF